MELISRVEDQIVLLIFQTSSLSKALPIVCVQNILTLHCLRQHVISKICQSFSWKFENYYYYTEYYTKLDATVMPIGCVCLHQKKVQFQLGLTSEFAFAVCTGLQAYITEVTSCSLNHNSLVSLPSTVRPDHFQIMHMWVWSQIN